MNGISVTDHPAQQRSYTLPQCSSAPPTQATTSKHESRYKYIRGVQIRSDCICSDFGTKIFISDWIDIYFDIRNKMN